MKKKNLLVFPLLLPLLAACDFGGGNGGDDPKVSGACEIQMWHNSNATTEALLQNFVDAFQKENKDITVTLTKQSGDYSTLLSATLTGITSDNYPDIFLGYPDSVSQLIGYGKVVNLEKLMDDPTVGWTAEEKEDIIPAYLDEGAHYQVPGTYSLPYAKSTEAMYYSDKLLGLDLKAQDASINNGQPLTEEYINNLTWEELFGKLCPALEAKNASLPDAEKFWLESEKGYHSILAWSSDDNCFITMCEQYGYDYTKLNESTGNGKPTFNNDNVKNMLKTLYDAHEKHYFITSKSAGGSYTNTLFSQRNVLFDIGSTGGGQYYSGANNSLVDFHIAKIPHAAGKDPKVINQGPSLAILKHKNADNKDDEARVIAAWKFYKFITNSMNAEVFAETTGYSPIRYSVYDSKNWADYASTEGKTSKSLEHTYAQIANYTTKVTNNLFASPVFNGSAACRTQVSGLLGNILNMESWTDAQAKEFMDMAENTALLSCAAD